MDKYGAYCYICGIALQPHNIFKHNAITLDHVTAKSKLGLEVMSCCKDCNERKKDMDLLKLEKGMVIKFGGLPFELATDIQVFGEEKNIELAKEYANQPLELTAGKRRNSA